MNFHFIWSSAVASLVSVIAFAMVHDIWISDIWFSLEFMLFAGAICGMSVGWCYGILFKEPVVRNWIMFNGLFLVMFILLAIISVMIFEPVTTISAVIAANEAPVELIRQAMPLTVIYILVVSLILNQFYGRSRYRFGVILITTTLLVLLLGLNVSVIGLVSVSSGTLYLILEMFGLILLIDLVFAGVFILLEYKILMQIKLKDSGTTRPD